MDFTLKTYKLLLHALKKQGFSFLTFSDFILEPKDMAIVLRHDVDLLPGNSLKFARIQSEMGINGTYYFRIVPESFDETIIKEIYELGHEVGYHYEDLSFAYAKLKAEGGRRRAEGYNNSTLQLSSTEASAKVGFNSSTEEQLAERAIISFKENLDRFRQIVPVKTICMHGSPISKWDSRLLWKYYNYRDFGIIGEPYFDIDFDKVFYLTDTGRRWDGDSFNIRDKAQGAEHRAQGKGNPATSNQQPAAFPKFHSTFDIIKAAQGGKLPDQIMMTFHPQRWTDKPLPWVKELVWQNTKNVVKYFVVKRSNE